MSPLRSSASPSRPAILAALAALVLHAGAGFLALRAPGATVVQPPVPLEVRFIVEAPPAVVPAPQPRVTAKAEPTPEPKREAKPQPARPPERKPEPRPVVRRTPPAQKVPPAPPPETLVADSARAAPEAPVAPVPQSSPPGPPVETAPAAPPPAAAAASAPAAPSAAPAALAAAPATSAPRFDAAYLANPPPAYPMISRRLGEEGRVLLRVHVEADGRPSSVELRDSSGFGRLDDAALRAVRGWRFAPARRGEQAVSAWVLVPINFTLKNS